MITELGKQRLLILADYLDKVEPTQFDFRTVVGLVDQDELNHFVDLNYNCETTACAIGHCPMIPEFKKLGLEYRRTNDGMITTAFADELPPPEPYWFRPWDAAIQTAKRLFGLDNEEVNFLFAPADDIDHEKFGWPEEDATAADVAFHIRQFVKNNGLPPSIWDSVFGSIESEEEEDEEEMEDD
jgi:hypothetical protein